MVFIATANSAETIPEPLLDRMEIVRLDGYTEDEKVLIARDHLMPRQLGRAGLRADEVTVSDDALRVVVTEYTREAGVRNLEREIGKVLRKVAAKVATEPFAVPVAIGPAADSGLRWPNARRCPAWPPVWRLPARVAMSCSSRRPLRSVSPVSC